MSSLSQEKLKKDITCRFYLNCRDGNQCPYYHPKSEKGAKNGVEEMQGVLHFLQKEMKNLKLSNISLMKEIREIKDIKKGRNRRRPEEENHGKMHY